MCLPKQPPDRDHGQHKRTRPSAPAQEYCWYASVSTPSAKAALRRWCLRVSVTLLIGMAGLCGALYIGRVLHMFTQSPAPARAITQLQIGMTKGEVTGLLGQPSAVWQDGTWVYTKPGAWAVLYLWFDEDEKVSQYHYDR